MSALYITGLPGTDGRVRATALLALRDALRVLHEDAAVTSEQALAIVQGRSLPFLLGETDSDTAIEAASGLLEAQGFQIGVDLPPESLSELRTAQNEPAEPRDDAYFDFQVARTALALMQAAEGNPMKAIAVAATMSNVTDENNAEDGLFMEAGSLLVATFRMDIHQETIALMALRAGMDDNDV